MDGSPAQRANAFAAAAEEHLANGRLSKAVEAHFRAAELFLLAMNDTTNPEAVKTLKLLYASHTRNGKELQRRLQLHTTALPPSSASMAPPSASSPPAAASTAASATRAASGADVELAPSSVVGATSPAPSMAIMQMASTGTHSRSTPIPSQQPAAPATTATTITPLSSSPTRTLLASLQKRPSAVHFYSSQPSDSPTPSEPIQPPDASLLGSRQFFVGQPQSDSAILQHPSIDFTRVPTSLPPSQQHHKSQQSQHPFARISPSVSTRGAVFGFSVAGVGTNTSAETGAGHTQQSAASSSNTNPVDSTSAFSAHRSVSAKLKSREPATVPVTSLDSSNVSQSIAHSYLVLDKDAKEVGQDGSLEDPFDKFWEAVEGLVQKISVSAPVAFATVPLHGDRQAASGSGGTVASDGAPENTTQIPMPAPQRDQDSLPDSMQNTGILQSYMFVPSNVPTAEQARQSGLSTLQYMVPLSSPSRRNTIQGAVGANREALYGMRPADITDSSSKTPPTTSSYGTDGTNSLPSRQESIKPSTYMSSAAAAAAARLGKKTTEEYQIENDHLKQIVDKLTRRVALLERATEENSLLKSSIIQFRQDVQKQAKRYKHGANAGLVLVGAGGSSSGHSVTSATGPQTPLPLGSSGTSSDASGSKTPTATTASDMSTGLSKKSFTTADVSRLLGRIQSLEDEVRVLRQENERQSSAMAKYKDRWDKLKESAKKKKEAKSSTLDGTNAAFFDPSSSLSSLMVSAAAGALPLSDASAFDSQSQLQHRGQKQDVAVRIQRTSSRDMPPLPPESVRRTSQLGEAAWTRSASGSSANESMANTDFVSSPVPAALPLSSGQFVVSSNTTSADPTASSMTSTTVLSNTVVFPASTSREVPSPIPLPSTSEPGHTLVHRHTTMQSLSHVDRDAGGISDNSGVHHASLPTTSLAQSTTFTAYSSAAPSLYYSATSSRHDLRRRDGDDDEESDFV